MFTGPSEAWDKLQRNPAGLQVALPGPRQPELNFPNVQVYNEPD